MGVRVSEYIDVIGQLVREAGKMQIERLREVHTIERKEEIQLVTEVDRACERFIVDEISKRYPDHDILAEEGSGRRITSDSVWFVDPLDGTVNYAHGFPFFGVSIAFQRKGELVAGAVFDPNRHELFAAEHGGGAFLNEAPIVVSETSGIKDALLATGFAYVDRNKAHLENIDFFEAFVRDARAVRRPGAATIDLAYVACGRLDGFWELNLKPWDTAAGTLIIREAGGKVTAFDGGDFAVAGNQILATNGIIHDEMSAVLTRAREH